MGRGGEKMSKSLGNFVTAQELVEKGYDPIAMRYLILTSHYKKGLNFSFESLDSAVNALNNLRSLVSGLKSGGDRSTLSDEKENKVSEYREKFVAALADDINVPQALAILWEMLKSNIPSGDKYDLAMSFDEVLGLKLNEAKVSDIKIPENIKILISKRGELRKQKKFEEADVIRKQIEEAGFMVSDTPIS
jgi:cysteinyl-tRNA synthetase